MQPVHDAGLLEPQPEKKISQHRKYIKWTILSLITAVNGYAPSLCMPRAKLPSRC